MTRIPENDDAVSRRGFLRNAALAAMSAALLPKGLIPVALADDASILPGKSGLTILNDRPWLLRDRFLKGFVMIAMASENAEKFSNAKCTGPGLPMEP